MKISPKRAGAIAATVGALLAASACSSATQDSSSASATGGSADSACVQKAQAVVDKARAAMPLAAPTAPLDGSKMAGKNIWLISVLSNQWTQGVNAGMVSAAKDMGVKLTVFDGQGQVDKWNQGIEQAIAAKADGIAMNGIDPKLVSQSIADAKAAGIPVLNAMSATPKDPVQPGVFTNMQADNYTDGYNTAAWMIANSGCKADSLLLYSSALVVWKAQEAGAVQAFQDLCPTACKLTVKQVDLANLATDMPRQTQTALTQDRNIDYVYPVMDSAVPFIEPAVSATNPNVTIVSRDGVPENLASIRKGSTLQKVDVVMPPEAWFGFAFLDNISRAVLGMQPSGVQVPTMLVDKTNIASSDTAMFPAYADFETEFKKMWGLA